MKPIQQDELTVIASIDQVSKLLDIPKSTLRYYDREGIIQSKRHEDKDNSYRIYSRQDILTLFDFLQYRNMDISVKDIQDLNSLSIEARHDMLLNLIETNRKRMEEILEANKELLWNISILQRYLLLKNQGYHITDTIGINKINEFHVLEPSHVQQWLHSPFSTTYTLLYDSSSLNCAYEGLSNVEDFDSPVIWTPAESTSRYVDCLTWTKYASPYENNIEEHLAWMKEHDLVPGKIICLFLIPIVDEETGDRHDVYHTWIEIL